ncbi:unnamed protein product [Triticum turgidum subsp. durum]|uniref:Uncharacterized protein n=2 Tax=Triticum TaxID=4564 RepID=A0A9R1Q9R5_TRITD|nr:unnamed protein product [Triticum aestivum]VAH73402.1 unnamed protein product [Triticum turgidum subsp. durum]
MARQDVLMEPQSPGSPASPGKPLAPELPEPYAEMRPLDVAPDEEAAVKPDRRTSSASSSSSRASSAGCVFQVDASEMRTPLVEAAADGDDDHADAGPAAQAKLPEDWASFSERSTGGGTVSAAPEAQTMAKPAVEGFNPDRIPASIFQPKPGAQADWSIASNESLFSIHGASLSISDDLYAPSRSHFDYFYDEAMAAGGSGYTDGKLPPLAEVPGSAMSDASEGRAIRRHESGSIGSSSNFSFAFPMYTGRAIDGDEGEHGRLPAAAEGARAVAAAALEPQVAVRGDDDGGGAAAAEGRVVLVRGVLLARLLLAHLLLPMAVAVLLLSDLLPVQLVPLRGGGSYTRNGGERTQS